MSPTWSQDKLSTNAKVLGCLPRAWPCLSLSCTDTKPWEGTLPSLFEQVQPEPSLPTSNPGAFWAKKGFRGIFLTQETRITPKEMLPQSSVDDSHTFAPRHTRQILIPKMKRETKIRNCERNWHTEPCLNIPGGGYLGRNSPLTGELEHCTRRKRKEMVLKCSSTVICDHCRQTGGSCSHLGWDVT